ncbi:Hypothetical predicted protein [Pelobates cultripes]|uniref:Uncharacterized protein n=1 Tax=Pelobates cultripes TaxID=61616 RepID=A0AAD1SHM1_PELCU|nr:Hypothetical predicted protein [Pelobates cultripes]
MPDAHDEGVKNCILTLESKMADYEDRSRLNNNKSNGDPESITNTHISLIFFQPLLLMADFKELLIGRAHILPRPKQLPNSSLQDVILNSGDDLESDRYLITVEAEDVGGIVPQNISDVKQAPPINRNAPKPVGLRPPVGLKRKFSGFQGPRGVQKKASLEMEHSLKPSTQTLVQECSNLPSQLYTTSPLFAAHYRKTGETNIGTPCDVLNTMTLTSSKQNPAGNFLPTNSYSSFQNKVRDKVADTNKGETITQNIRSTAQILSLLRFQPEKNGVETSVRPNAQQSAKCNTEVLNYEISMKPIPVTSKWDIYLDKSQSSNSVETTQKRMHLPDLPDSPDNSLSLSLNYIVDSNNGQTPLQTGTNGGPYSLLKTDRPVEQSVLNNIQLSGHLQTEKLPVPTIDLQQGFKYSQAKTFMSEYESSAEGMANNMTYSNIPNTELTSHDEQSHCRTYVQDCSSSEGTTKDKAETSCSPAKAEHQKLNLQQKIEYEEFSEVSFNLMDSFDFESSDEDSKEKKLSTQSSSHFPEGRMDMHKGETERLFPGDASEKVDSEKNVCARLHLTIQDGETADNKDKKCPISEDVCGERNVNKAYEQDMLSLMAVDMNLSFMSDINIITESPNKESDSSTKGTFQSIRHSLPTSSNCCESETKMTIVSSNLKPTTEIIDTVSKDSSLLPYKEQVENQMGICENVSGSAKYLKQESPLNSNDSVLQDVLETPQSPTLANNNPHIEGDVCEEADTELLETVSGDSISLLRTLTKHSTALESLSILHGKCQSQKKVTARKTCTQIREEEG